MKHSTTLKAAALLIFIPSLGLLYYIYLLLPLCGFWGQSSCPPPVTSGEGSTAAPTITSTPTPQLPVMEMPEPTPIEIRVGIALDESSRDSALGSEQNIALNIVKTIFDDYLCTYQEQNFIQVRPRFCITLVSLPANADIDPETARDNAIMTFETLIEDYKVDIIIGPTYSQQAVEAHKLAEAAGVLVIAISNTADGIVEGKDYIFRVSAPVGVYAKSAIVEIQNQVNNIALVYLAGDDFTESEKNAFQRQISNNGLNYIELPYTSKPNQVDFLPLVTEIITPTASNSVVPDLVVIAGRYSDTIKIIKQLRASGYKEKLVAGNGINVNRISQDCKQECVGVYVAQTYNPNQPYNSINKEFIEIYQGEMGNNGNPSQIMAQMFTAFQVIIKATDTLVENSNGSIDNFRNSLREQLLSSNRFDTLLGPIHFDHEGEICQPEFYVAQIQDPNDNSGTFKIVGGPQNRQLNLGGKRYRDYPPSP